MSNEDRFDDLVVAIFLDCKTKSPTKCEIKRSNIMFVVLIMQFELF
jgi:hypothetical protein